MLLKLQQGELKTYYGPEGGETASEAQASSKCQAAVHIKEKAEGQQAKGLVANRLSP